LPASPEKEKQRKGEPSLPQRGTNSMYRKKSLPRFKHRKRKGSATAFRPRQRSEKRSSSEEGGRAVGKRRKRHDCQIPPRGGRGSKRGGPSWKKRPRSQLLQLGKRREPSCYERKGKPGHPEHADRSAKKKGLTTKKESTTTSYFFRREKGKERGGGPGQTERDRRRKWAGLRL